MKSLKRIPVYFSAFLIFIFTVFPFYWIVVTSFTPKGELFSTPPSLVPTQFTLDNYRIAMENDMLVTFSMNSLYVAFWTILFVVTISLLGAYAIARFTFIGKKLLVKGVSVTQMFPAIILLLPFYLLARKIGLYNSLWSLIITYTALQVPIAIMLMIGYFQEIPREIEEAAYIDGCSKFQTLYKIILPLAKSGIVATAIFVFVNIWQEFLFAVSFLSTKAKYTLTVGISSFQGQYGTEWGALMAISVIIAVPALIAFVSVQKYFINSLVGSVKG